MPICFSVLLLSHESYPSLQDSDPPPPPQQKVHINEVNKVVDSPNILIEAMILSLTV